MTYRALDLCAGAAGAWSLGLHRAGIETVAACEAVAWRRDLYAANFPGVKLYDDLRTLTGARLADDLGYLPDALFGSPPCKEYSEVNTRGRGLDGDDLFLHAVRLVGECRPLRFGFENSARIRTRGYDRIARELDAIGYACWPVVLEGGVVGARHIRPRAFLLGADLSRPQGRPAGQPRKHGHVGRGADREAGGWAGRDWPRLGPVGSADLGGHLRAHARVPDSVAEQCREAYGDSLFPLFAEAVGRAILAVDAALAEPGRAAA